MIRALTSYWCWTTATRAIARWKRRRNSTCNRVALRGHWHRVQRHVHDKRLYAAQARARPPRRGATDEDMVVRRALADNLMQRYGSSLLDFNTRLRVRVKSNARSLAGRGVKVSSEFLRQGGAPIPIDYLMRRPAAVEGVRRDRGGRVVRQQVFAPSSTPKFAEQDQRRPGPCRNCATVRCRPMRAE